MLLVISVSKDYFHIKRVGAPFSDISANCLQKLEFPLVLFGHLQLWVGLQFGPPLVKEVDKAFFRIVWGPFGQCWIIRKYVLKKGTTFMFPLPDLEISIFELE